MTPQQFLENRFSALNRGDYAAVFSSYHEESPFRQQFEDCDAYARFARQQLCSIEVRNWRCVRQRTLDPEHVECLLFMELSVDKVVQRFYELALLIRTGDGWRYHSAQKLGHDEYTGLPDRIDFHHFNHATDKIRY